ncbi:MFS transporter [Candidatus Woesearchaeota archaeon]|jgi:MFS family permease|nr:MFS transporter [Candidatus Woesearchaeota archaeon]MDP6739124.1 MFS transporter [Planctomycetota bacterium]MDP6938882.1 MFS transporter [Planctomycetota bacterium]HJM57787.1 MFS transporter [Planctomycetota bacterium]
MTQRRSILFVAFLTVFLDMVGFSIIFPLFPSLLEHYLELEGPDGTVGRVRAALLVLAESDWAVTTLFGGLLGSLYSVLQFVSAPLWGAASDRRGRRTILLWTLAGTALSYVGWIFAGSFALLILARAVGGIMAGNISTVSAAIADTHKGPDRAKGMGMLGAGIGLGFVVGPAIGGVLAGWSAGLEWTTAGWGLNPFSGCAAVALVLSMANLILAARLFPETHPVEKRGKEAGERTLRPFAALKQMDLPGVRGANRSYFLYSVAFAAMEFTLPFLVADRFGFGPMDIAKMFVFIGLTLALVQGGLVRRLVPRFGEVRLTTLGMALTIPALVTVGLAQSVLLLYVGLGLLAAGSAAVMPSLSALVSRYSPADRQGMAMGIFRSMGSLARALGPILGGMVYWKLGNQVPYPLAAAVIVVPLLIARGLPQPTE